MSSTEKQGNRPNIFAAFADLAPDPSAAAPRVELHGEYGVRWRQEQEAKEAATALEYEAMRTAAVRERAASLLPGLQADLDANWPAVEREGAQEAFGLRIFDVKRAYPEWEAAVAAAEKVDIPEWLLVDGLSELSPREWRREVGMHVGGFVLMRNYHSGMAHTKRRLRAQAKALGTVPDSRGSYTSDWDPELLAWIAGEAPVNPRPAEETSPAPVASDPTPRVECESGEGERPKPEVLNRHGLPYRDLGPTIPGPRRSVQPVPQPPVPATQWYAGRWPDRP